MNLRPAHTRAVRFGQCEWVLVWWVANISARATSGMLGQVGGGRELGNTPNSLDPLEGALAEAHLVEIAEVVRLRVANRLQKRDRHFSRVYFCFFWFHTTAYMNTSDVQNIGQRLSGVMGPQTPAHKRVNTE